MKENLKNVARLILYAVYAFLISAVILKLWYENKNWLIISILCSVSNITANIIFNYKIYSDETQQGQAKIINFKTKLTEKNKTSMKMIIIDSIITIVGAYFIFAFFIGVLFEVENWADLKQSISSETEIMEGKRFGVNTSIEELKEWANKF